MGDFFFVFQSRPFENRVLYFQTHPCIMTVSMDFDVFRQCALIMAHWHIESVVLAAGLLQVRLLALCDFSREERVLRVLARTARSP